MFCCTKNNKMTITLSSLLIQICPICAALPGGDPNHVTDDFTAHLTLEHRAPRDLISFLLRHTPVRTCDRSTSSCEHQNKRIDEKRKNNLCHSAAFLLNGPPPSRRVEQRSTCTQDVPPRPRAGRFQSAADEYALY